MDSMKSKLSSYKINLKTDSVIRDLSNALGSEELKTGKFHKVINGNCEQILEENNFKKETGLYHAIDLTFLDPPFNQDKEYAEYDDNLPTEKYWGWMGQITKQIYDLTTAGGAIYFMQREKNAELVLKCLRKSGWCFQNLIVWKKKTSAVPGAIRFGKHYQIIVFATKGHRPRVFNRLRIDPPLPPQYKHERENGMFVTDVWDDIRELTSGYFAGDEAIRDSSGIRLHKQQSPISLLLRIILSSSMPGDLVLDPFAGTGTTSVASSQLQRNSIAIELDPINVRAIQDRLTSLRVSDRIQRFINDYRYTPDFQKIYPNSSEIRVVKNKQLEFA